MTYLACDMCDEPMHRYGWPADADRHQPSLTACVNTLTATVDELLRLVQRRADAGDVECQQLLARRRRSGQGVRYPEAFTDRQHDDQETGRG